MNILVLGASGMLGSAIVRILSANSDWQVFGSLRNEDAKKYFSKSIAKNLIVAGDILDQANREELFDRVGPDVVINCVSLSKQSLKIPDPLLMIPVYALLPHQLVKQCEMVDARLIHISSDAVFSGKGGNYAETDVPDPVDLYGQTKLLGEVRVPGAVTLRLSMIGPELVGSEGLLGWFLSQSGSCKGFSRAMFSGLPTCELALIIRDYVIPRSELYGIYHIAADPISKFELFKLIADVYGKSIALLPDDKLEINRSLNAVRFNVETGYAPPDWRQLINELHSYHLTN